MEVVRGRAGKPSENRTATFTGKVWGDGILSTGNVTVNDVYFEPGARTNWHKHEEGQLLLIQHGAGYVVNEAGDVLAVRAGDKVFIPAGEVHWHGGAPDSYMLHTAISLKKTEWLHPVSDDDYEKAGKE
ncbi:MAG TPA: cupin domain-containing protein [Bacillales bacterium]|nr:cupin domain-containing protein [Bacillales bacterium]